tara:strand:- start:1527 stop:3608 length:2082 start_codon:yes stop_codon:yes gene_type:complete
MLFVKYFNKKPLALAISIALLASIGSATAYESPVHVFSVKDVLGGLNGVTFSEDPSIICDIGEISCPSDNLPFLDKSGVMLYPVDSEFGFYVVDFLGAQPKARNGDYLEGFVGNILDGGEIIGIQVANAATEKYKVKPPLGTWCQGLGGTSVKCETEHYTVMEHALSCYETIPYFFASPDGTQAILSTPDGSLSFDCANAPLDDNVQVLVGGKAYERLIKATPCVADNDPIGCQMFPNDKTNMLDNIALSTDYSIQLKDDGKPLYGWGGIHKRPNDIRMYAQLALPAEWKDPAANFVVTRAELVVNHWITNNPNDQLRPEDLENEAATGRKPSYRIEGEGDTAIWKSTVPCYEGDSDIIDTDEGSLEPSFIGIGTVLKNSPKALDPAASPGSEPSDHPYAFSSDLVGGYSNAYYTTLNRDPFEWSYDTNPDPNIQDFIGSALPDASLGELVSGPRWRLKPNKFGQDLPGMEIPLIECSAPPFAKDNVKYTVGIPTTTVINLLDWAEGETSPLATSKGWVDVTANEYVTIVSDSGEPPVTSNGLPMTSDFDLAVYIKGDSKSTALYNAQLIIEYEGEVPVVNTEVDVALTAFAASAQAKFGDTVAMVVEVANLKESSVSGEVSVSGVTNRGLVIHLPSLAFSDLASGAATSLNFSWPVNILKNEKIIWTATVFAEGDLNNDNNTGTAITKIRRF